MSASGAHFKHQKWQDFMKVCVFIALEIEVFNFFKE